MKYGVRQARLNIVAAAVILALGIFFLLFGLSEWSSPKFGWYVWSGWSTSVMSGIIFGVLFIAIGTHGIYFFAKHQRTKIKKAKSKEESRSGDQVG